MDKEHNYKSNKSNSYSRLENTYTLKSFCGKCVSGPNTIGCSCLFPQSNKDMYKQLITMMNQQ